MCHLSRFTIVLRPFVANHEGKADEVSTPRTKIKIDWLQAKILPAKARNRDHRHLKKELDACCQNVLNSRREVLIITFRTQPAQKLAANKSLGFVHHAKPSSAVKCVTRASRLY